VKEEQVAIRADAAYVYRRLQARPDARKSLRPDHAPQRRSALERQGVFAVATFLQRVPQGTGDLSSIVPLDLDASQRRATAR
jgi:hypothetical protein